MSDQAQDTQKIAKRNTRQTLPERIQRFRILCHIKIMVFAAGLKSLSKIPRRSIFSKQEKKQAAKEWEEQDKDNPPNLVAGHVHLADDVEYNGNAEEFKKR